jgi:hypothetical protein
MKYNRYKYDDVEIGDSVYFDDVYSGKYLTQSNYDLYWEVTGKDERNVMLKLNYIGKDHYWIVKYDEIRQVEKCNKAR